MRQSGFVFGPCSMSELSAFFQRLERIYGNISMQELMDHFAAVQQAKREGTLLDADPIR
jgi:hypothetical protein